MAGEGLHAVGETLAGLHDVPAFLADFTYRHILCFVIESPKAIEVKLFRTTASNFTSHGM